MAQEIPPLLRGRDAAGRLLYGAGPGVGLDFVHEYFPQTRQVLRVATAYFTLRGYQLGRELLQPPAQLRILVGHSEEKHAYEAVADEIVAELGQCQTDLMRTVADLLRRIRTGQFFIREARSMRVPFHCKFYLIDEQVLWHGSCNYTYKGLKISAEQASASHNPAEILAWIGWYDEVAAQAHDLLRELEERLHKWYQLATPFEAYLRMLQLLDHLPELPQRPGVYPPTFYQRGVIARALRQERTYGGALIVAATGLGKTIIGAEIAERLQLAGRIKRTVLIAPAGVRREWHQQLAGRDVNYTFYTSQVIFRDTSDQPHHSIYALEQEIKRADQHTLLLIDEAHFYRNQLLVDESERRATRSRVYERIRPLLAAGARVVLLTATVYGTSLKNLDSLLHLLPPQQDAATGTSQPWKATSAEKFLQLPVVTVLGLPHVLRLAKERNDIDEHGRTFIQFAHERRYLPPLLRLRTETYRLLLQPEMEQAADARCFDQQYKVMQSFFVDEVGQNQVGLTDAVYNSTLGSWLSSPAAAAVSLHKNVHSLGADGQRPTGKRPRRGAAKYESPLFLPADERRKYLEPLLTVFQESETAHDAKYRLLAGIIARHCVAEHGKVLVFVNRLSTAVYLKRALAQEFATVRVGCTVLNTKGVIRLVSSEQRSAELRGFSPKSHYPPTGRDKYEVLICTDADGVGVNLQDCATVVNYDPPGGADVLFQRVGRVLRMTTAPDRDVHVYTLVPSILEETANQSRVARNIRQLFERMTQRHEKSRGIMGSAAFTTSPQLDIALNGDVDALHFVQQDELLTEVGGLGAASFLTHSATLEKHRAQASQLPTYLLSAKLYAKAQPRVVVLIRQGTNYRFICYNCRSWQPETVPDWELLDWVKCDPATPKAPVLAEQVEHAANEAVRHWAAEHSGSLEEIIKLSAVYLLPTHAKANQTRQLITSLAAA